MFQKCILKNGCLEPKTQFPLGKLQKDMTTGVGMGGGGWESNQALAVRQEKQGMNVLLAPKANSTSQAGLEGRSHVLFTFVSSVTSKILVSPKHPNTVA